jgi:glycosyltransferase involved in cell wall biosynthesis
MRAQLRGIPAVRLLDFDTGPASLRAFVGPTASRSEWAHLPAQLFVAARSIVRVTRYVLREKISVIHTDEWPRDAALAVAIGRVTRRKSLVHLHVAYGTWMSPMLCWALRHADAVAVVSEFVANSVEAFGVPRERIHVLYNAIPIADWTPRFAREEVRQELGISSDTFVVITVCRIGRGKGPAQLVESFSTLRDQRPNSRLLIVGNAQDPVFLAELEGLIVKLGLSDSVVMTGHRKDVARLMSAADVFAMPSDAEPFGLVYLEAMAMELPVLALNNGGTPEVVLNGVTGLLSELGDTPCMSENLITLSVDGELGRRLGKAGRMRVESLFQPARLARDVVGLYAQLAEDRQTSRCSRLKIVWRSGLKRLILHRDS